jgi:hypothetical protein
MAGEGRESTPLSRYFASPDIRVTRNDAGKRGGYITIDDDNRVITPGAFIQPITEAMIEGLDNEYTLNGLLGNKFDFTLGEGFAYVNLTNIQEGQELAIIANNNGPGDCLFVFSATEVIKWLNDALPLVHTNCKIILYKSKNIIYAEFKSAFIGGGGSDSGSF